MISAGYPAGCTDATIDAYWGNTDRSQAADEELEIIQNECAAIRARLDALDKKERHFGLSASEEDEAVQLESELADNECEIQRINYCDWREDELCAAADRRRDELLGD